MTVRRMPVGALVTLLVGAAVVLPGEASGGVEVAPLHEFFDAGDVPQFVTPGSPAISTIEIDVDAPIVDLDVGLVVDHARTSDLVITLTNEQSGRSAVLVSNEACGGAAIDVVVDDEAGPPPPCTGRVAPAEALSVFDGSSFKGTWRLNVRDRRAGSNGTLVQWSMQPELDLTGGAVAVLGDRNLDLVRSQLAAAGAAPAVLGYPLGTPPTAAGLDRFDAVLIYATQSLPNADAYGTAMVDYLDGGGGVVVANLLWSEDSGIRLGGRFAAAGYQVFEPGAAAQDEQTLVFTDHPLTAGLGAVRAANWSNVTMAGGAQLVAAWGNGVPAVGTRLTTRGRIVGLNLPALPSTVYPGWDEATAGDDLIAAALRWSMTETKPCGGLAVTIEGTPGPDVLVGTKGSDVIDGRGGDDVIKARRGDDVICGGPGDDRIAPGPGDDTINAGRGRDRVAFGGRSGVVLRLDRGRATGQGSDAIRGVEDALGSRGPDLLVGSRRANLLRGRGGDDVLRGRVGRDVLNGGRGTDLANGGPGPDSCAAERTRAC